MIATSKHDAIYAKTRLTAWKTETKCLLLLGTSLIFYGVYTGQFVRDALLKKRPASMTTHSEQWSWVVTPEFWTIGMGLAMVLLSSLIIEKEAKWRRYFLSRWLFRRVNRIGQVPLTNKGEQRSMETQAESNQKEETPADRFADRLSDMTAQCLTHPQHSRFIMARDQPQISFNLPHSSELATDIESKTDLDLAPDKVLPNTNANFASNDIRPLMEQDLPSNQHFFGDHEICLDKSENPANSGSRNRHFHKGTSSYLSSLYKLETTVDPEIDRKKRAETTTHLSEKHEGALPNLNQKVCDISITDTGGTSAFSLSTPKGFGFCACPASGSSTSLKSTKSETTQTCYPGVCLTYLSRGTMTDAFTADSCVSTHGKPCRLVRHYSTSTTGPFMKKLRRAHRLLEEARKTSRCDQASSAAKWRKILDRYKHKMELLTGHLTKKDEMVGGTSSRITVIRGEIKEALLAVRSTRERLTTQCKLNAALMDVIESKSENPTYGADLHHHGSGFKQEQRGPQ